jgi:hypothetical protein
MTATSHQTIRLSRGRHSSPEEGACVMELASMLAGERFTDHPESVCPVIGSFLRTYNDSIDDERRQDLYYYASRVVGSRSSEEVQQARSEYVERWTRKLRRERRKRFLLPRTLVMLWPGTAVGIDAAFAVHEACRRGADGHGHALALIDELLAIGRPVPSQPTRWEIAAPTTSATAEPITPPTMTSIG